MSKSYSGCHGRFGPLKNCVSGPDGLGTSEPTNVNFDSLTPSLTTFDRSPLRSGKTSTRGVYKYLTNDTTGLERPRVLLSLLVPCHGSCGRHPDIHSILLPNFPFALCFIAAESPPPNHRQRTHTKTPHTYNKDTRTHHRQSSALTTLRQCFRTTDSRGPGPPSKDLRSRSRRADPLELVR